MAAGHRVIAASRNPSKTPEAVAKIESGSDGKWMKLDVSADDLEQQLDACVQVYGTIDVLVNNAGYATGGALEDVTLTSVRAQVETNLFGPVRTMKALIPHMRERGTGTIVNVTSTEGISAAPGISMYGASKHPLEAVSEALQGELAPFGIRMLVVEPGGMRTSFLHPEKVAENLPPISAPYKGTMVQCVLDAVLTQHGAQMLDPERSAKRIVEAVDGGGEGWPENCIGTLTYACPWDNVKAMEGI
ncbi:hypothetical protein LTR36_000285 [Oleoguttula mirabilis]|uniref:Uncharacterized protein n=1 Tax=Oleoguttula mirabilis TaxID=1507867 RepID=A0AAV9JYP3_9PEZI|nr:hypothetical protein LTR36_000285 [Oleoguttula mirabilis]